MNAVGRVKACFLTGEVTQPAHVPALTPRFAAGSFALAAWLFHPMARADRAAAQNGGRT
jgi:hypothetical protein